MANSSPVSGSKYDVFISFRGIDVRHSFLSHLKKELRQKEIDAYVDDKLERGDDISPALLRAIEESLISLIIFSKDYASSKWCLEELVKIIECKQKNNQTVIPVFYNTDPSDVRHQKGSYADAFAEHEKNYKEKVQLWRYALNKAANLSGFDSSKYGDEVELIEKIAKSLSTRLTTMIQSNTRDIVGIDQQIADLESLMCQESQDVRAIGIWGIGGIGKTTIAAVVFNRFCFEYEGSCFMANVREESHNHGIINLKNKLLSQLLKEDNLHIGTLNGITPYVKRRLLRKKVLIVLDDINDSDQIENLVGALDYFGSGSRIIITTRDKQVCGQLVHQIYEVKPMIFEDAIQLFMLNAFKKTCPDMEWIELSRRVISYAKGIPLAVKILGSFLCGKSKEEWESKLEKLKKMPYTKIHDVLRLSYDSLDDEEKSIFLYIACFFKGYEQRRIIIFLDACGFLTTIGLKVLRDKALIDWEFEMSFVSMHDLIQEMGKEIVRQKSTEDIKKRSWLWNPNDIYEVLKNNRGTEAIQSIILDMSKIEELFLNPEVFAGMDGLKFLKFFYNISLWRTDRRAIVHLPHGLGSFPKELRLLHWDEYPLKSLPSTFSAERLIELEMRRSRMEKLWDGVQCLVNLKKIDLCYSECLLVLPDFSEAINLEEVYLYGCTNLRLVHPSILSLPKLKSLDLSKCENITNLRSDIPLKALQFLLLEHCKALNDFSVTSANMTMLNLSGTAITELPSSIGSLSDLGELTLYNCRSLMNLPSQLVDLRDLYELNIGGCIKLRSLTDLPPSLEEIYAKDCISLETVQFTSMVVDPPNGNMRMLNLSGTAITELPSSIGSLCNLEELDLYNCRCLMNLPLVDLRSLRELRIGCCIQLRSLTDLPPSLEAIYAEDCISLETIQFTPMAADPHNESMRKINFRNCMKLDEHSLHVLERRAHLKLKNYAFKHLSPDEEEEIFKEGVDAIYPGSKVPDWFMYRTSQASITIDPHSELQGFICCVTLHPLQESDTMVRCYWCLEDTIDCSRRFPQRRHDSLLSGHLPIGDFISDHVLLWYDDVNCDYINERIQETRARNQPGTYPKITFELYAFSRNPNWEERDVIKECGVYPVYASEGDNFIEKMKLGNKTKRCRDIDELEPSEIRAKSSKL